MASEEASEAAVTSSPQGSFSSSLLVLPRVLQQQVLSWSPDGNTANALLNSCSELHHLRRDPASAALLLLRCGCQQYDTALTSCSGCEGGTSAVVHQLLHLLRASADPGDRAAAPRQLLSAALVHAAAHGDVPALQGVMATRAPTKGALHEALRRAVLQGPHLPAIRMLLQSGADPTVQVGSHSLFKSVATTPPLLAALQPLLSACPLDKRTAALGTALGTAIEANHRAAVEVVLPSWLQSPASAEVGEQVHIVRAAASMVDTGVLQLLLEGVRLNHSALSWGLGEAVRKNRVACAALLLDWSACTRQDQLDRLLEEAVAQRGPGPAVEEMVRLLLAHGAVPKWAPWGLARPRDIWEEADAVQELLQR